MRASWRILLAGMALAATAATAHGATIPVTTTLDGPITDPQTQDGLCSLREAVAAAVNDGPVQGCPAGSGADEVVLAAGTFTLTAGGGNEDQGFTGDLDVAGPPVRVVGAGSAATVIQVGFEDRAFDVRSTGTLTLEGLTIRGARLPDDSGASGAGVRNQGVLKVVRAAFEDNAAGTGDFSSGSTGGGGGAIWSGNSASPSVTVVESSFTGNRARAGFGPGGGGDGGAIRIESGTLSVTNSTFVSNEAGAGQNTGGGQPGGNGGAIAVSPGVATITGSTFASNRGGGGGSNSMGTPNPSGGNGGAVAAFDGGQALITWSTLLGNLRGPSSQGPNGISGALVGGSILADPEPRCGGVVASAPNLLSGPDGACLPGSAVGDPLLGLLAANGGPTLTLLPGAGSAAIDGAGGGCPATDQRGLARPALAACDFGAVEIQPGTPQAAGVPGAGAGTPLVRSITALAVGPATFRAAGRKPLGTNVRFRLGAAGTVVLTVRRPAAGKRSKGRCVAPTRTLRAARSCTRQITLPGRLTRQGVAGENLIRFSGRLRGRALAQGRYTLVVTLPRVGSSPAITAVRAFRIAR